MNNEGFLSLFRQTSGSEFNRLFSDLKDVARTLGTPIYVVGGFLRDMLIDTADKGKLDLDIVIEGDAIKFAESVQRRYGGTIRTHRRFGTANWLMSGIKNRWTNSGQPFPNAIDLISARKERYVRPGALPTVCRGTITDDIDRRDFSINTLAIRLDTDSPLIFDRHDALNDIQRGLIRILHNNSFIDDPTRIFRVIRYEQRYQFTLEPNTLKHLYSGLEYIRSVSGDRIRHEINRIFEEDHHIEILQRLDEIGILGSIYNGLVFKETQKERIDMVMKGLKPKGESQSGKMSGHSQQKNILLYSAWLSSLDPHISQACTSRLNLPLEIKDILQGYYDIQQKNDRFYSNLPIDVTEYLDAIPLLAVRIASVCEQNKKDKDILEMYIHHWRKIQPEITGNDLIKRDISPGPRYSTILRRLRAAKLDGIIQSRQEETLYLEKILAESNRDHT